MHDETNYYKVLYLLFRDPRNFKLANIRLYILCYLALLNVSNQNHYFNIGSIQN